MLHSYNVRNIKVRLTGCLSSNYSAVQLVPARPRGIVFGHSERERESECGAKMLLGRVLQRNATPAGCTGDYRGTDITRAG